jgi:CPA2 family monovalent cation:H+ antiporter-2
MGAFIAGIMLANSHFRHQLETDVEPFKGLTLGLFFIAIGMTLNINLLFEQPLLILFLALALMGLKTLIIFLLLVFSKVDWRSSLKLGLMLSQGGEFAFVIMSQAAGLSILSPEITETVNLVVGISMALTAPLLSVISFFIDKTVKDSKEGIDESMDDLDKESEILILGFGRFAQITGRILSANRIPFTALDNNANHINFIKRFGNKVYFGDIMRLDVLEAAGINNVNTVLITIEDGEKAVSLTQLIRQHYPEMHIIVRAYNRVNYLKLVASGANKVVREIFSGSLDAATETLVALGFTTGQALKTVDTFKQHDELLLERALEHHDDLDKVIEIGIQGRKELEDLFEKDKQEII